MSLPIIKTNFTTGEIAPGLYGHVDLAKYAGGASTMRNLFASYRGGAYSRAGTAFVGFSKQTGRSFPPRMITFQFSNIQGLALEFGHEYIRFVFQGAFVTETAYALTGISRANPAVVTFAVGATSATTNLGGVSAVYAPGDTVTLTGGTETANAVVTVDTTTVVSATVAAGGAGGTPGAQTVTGTTGTGTKFQANVTVSGGGAVTSVNSITVGGSYTANPAAPAMEPVTGASLTGAQLNVVLGPATVHVSTHGSYSAVPANPVAQGATSGSGLGATFNLTWAKPFPGFANGDWIEIDGVGGMTQVNGQTYVVANLTTTTFSLKDVYGNDINSSGFSAYTSGGTFARIYTVTAPWDEQDLPWLKVTQSADVMSIGCWNQSTGTSYPPYDLSRIADNNWTLTQLSTAAAISAPTNVSGSATNPTVSSPTDYNFVITASTAAGEESIASAVIDIADSVLISATAGSLDLSWDAVVNGVTYTIYKALAAYNSTVPQGSLFGYAGQTQGTQFVDSNITADFSKTPPIHIDPFSPGQIVAIPLLSGGASITGGVTINITTGTGSGFAGYVVVNASGVATAVVVQNGGEGYLSSDTVAFTAGGGTPPTGTLTVGPQTGTYPSVPAYFQERRVYAATPNRPDTYFMSQPGLFKNYDVRNPTIASDAITGTPWSVQVDGIQFMVPMPGGLVCLNGNSIWQVGGAGSSQLNPQPITPSSQQAQSQEANGISSTVPPIRINQDILYVQSKGAIIRAVTYQIFSNNFTGIDISVLSSHLFTGYQVEQWAWCQETSKVVWTVRSDGTMLSLTYLKEEGVTAWARHDTNGLFNSVCAVTEPPVDALYLATERFPPQGTCFMIERMDDRLWPAAEDCWCVDAGLNYGEANQPFAAIAAASAAGLGAISGFTSLVGGQNYNASATAAIVDNNGKGPGGGAVVHLTIVAGVITAITTSPAGSGYINPALVISDPTNQGSGASAVPTLDNSTTFQTTLPVFDSGMVGWVIRAGGGIARITAYTSGTQVTADILSPIQSVIGETGVMVPQGAGEWTLNRPTTTITGLNHLIGASVTGLADGNVIPPTTVASDGTITLSTAASQVIVGLGFTAQLQTPYLINEGSVTGQGQRKRITRATARVEASRGIMVGVNQQDGSALYPTQIAPAWVNLTSLTDLPGSTSYNALCPALWTGDSRVPVAANFDKPGQVAFQQSNPLPMQILAVVPEINPGDTPQVQVPKDEIPKPGRSSWAA